MVLYHKSEFLCWKKLVQFFSILLIIVFFSIETVKNRLLGPEVSFVVEKNYSDDNYTTPWPDDELCSTFTTRFGTNVPLTYLASYPRSGNTWVRYLIEGSTGIYTGSIYNDTRLSERFLGETDEWNSGRTIVVKVHPQSLRSTPLLSLSKTPVIFILRNPHKSIISYWDFLYAGRIGRRDEAFHFSPNKSSYLSEDFRRHVKRQTRIWEQCAQFFLSMTKNLHIVFYEELLSNTIDAVRKLLRFLKIPSDEGRLKCVQKFLDGRVKRNLKIKINPFTLQEQTHLTNAIANVAGLLKLRGMDVPKEYEETLSKRTYLTENLAD